MKRIVKRVAFLALAAGSMALTGCAGLSGLQLKPLTPTQQFAMACTNYDLALQGAILLGNVGVANKIQVDQAILVSHQFTPICEQGTPPANMVQVTQQLTNAVTSGVLQEGLQYVQKNPQALKVAPPSK